MELSKVSEFIYYDFFKKAVREQDKYSPEEIDELKSTFLEACRDPRPRSIQRLIEGRLCITDGLCRIVGDMLKHQAVQESNQEKRVIERVYEALSAQRTDRYLEKAEEEEEDTEGSPIENYTQVVPQEEEISRATRTLAGEKPKRGTIYCPIFQLKRVAALRAHKQKAVDTQPVRLVKKEAFRIQYIRSLKKVLRKAKSGTLPVKFICPVDYKQNSYWQELIEARSDFSDLPAHVLQSKRKEGSYKDSYCADFFSYDTVRRFHYRFAELVYLREPQELCSSLGSACCVHASHSKQCRQVWSEVYHFMKFAMLLELGFSEELLRSEAGTN